MYACDSWKLEWFTSKKVDNTKSNFWQKKENMSGMSYKKCSKCIDYGHLNLYVVIDLEGNEWLRTNLNHLSVTQFKKTWFRSNQNDFAITLPSRVVNVNFSIGLLNWIAACKNNNRTKCMNCNIDIILEQSINIFSIL